MKVARSRPTSDGPDRARAVYVSVFSSRPISWRPTAREPYRVNSYHSLRIRFNPLVLVITDRSEGADESHFGRPSSFKLHGSVLNWPLSYKLQTSDSWFATYSQPPGEGMPGQFLVNVAHHICRILDRQGYSKAVGRDKSHGSQEIQTAGSDPGILGSQGRRRRDVHIIVAFLDPGTYLVRNIRTLPWECTSFTTVPPTRRANRVWFLPQPEAFFPRRSRTSH